MFFPQHGFVLQTVEMFSQKRLLVSGRRPECSDCLLKSMEFNNNMKKLYVKIKNQIFLKKNLRFFWKEHPPTRHIKYKVIDIAPINNSIMAYKLP